MMLKNKKHHIIPAIILGAAAVTFLGFNTQPLLNSTGPFILLAQDQITLSQNVTVSSGVVGVDGRKGVLTIGSSNTLSSNLFASRITLGPQTTVNGSATFNNLTKTKDVTILGEENDTFSSPLVDFPAIADFQTGTEQFRTNPNDTATLSPGAFKNITTGPDTTLTLEPGTYNTDTLTLDNGTTVHFLGTTTINVKGNTTIGNSVVFSAPLTLSIDDIVVNSHGKQFSIGSSAITHGIITAPDATITIGQQTLHRGQIVGRHITASKGAILSREEFFAKNPDPDKVIESEGVQLIVNEILILLSDSAMFADAQRIADIVGGRITGFIDLTNIVKIEIISSTLLEINSAVEQIGESNDSAVEAITPNFIHI